MDITDNLDAARRCVMNARYNPQSVSLNRDFGLKT
jgi:predicted fused transcriptional regulator/phosphomethylpyrimidine kinase